MGFVVEKSRHNVSSCDNIERFYLGGAAHGCRRWTTGLGAAPVR
jgi:hypothetical protein